MPGVHCNTVGKGLSCGVLGLLQMVRAYLLVVLVPVCDNPSPTAACPRVRAPTRQLAHPIPRLNRRIVFVPVARLLALRHRSEHQPAVGAHRHPGRVGRHRACQADQMRARADQLYRVLGCGEGNRETRQNQRWNLVALARGSQSFGSSPGRLLALPTSPQIEHSSHPGAGWMSRAGSWPGMDGTGARRWVQLRMGSSGQLGVEM